MCSHMTLRGHFTLRKIYSLSFVLFVYSFLKNNCIFNMNLLRQNICSVKVVQLMQDKPEWGLVPSASGGKQLTVLSREGGRGFISQFPLLFQQLNSSTFYSEN